MQTTFEPLKLAGTAVISDVFDSLHLLPLVFDNAHRSPTTGQRPERLAV